MNYWLMKSEPSTWSWEQQVKAGAKGEGWDGVRNYQASSNMKKMAVGDLCFFYHSVKEKQIIGIVKVSKEFYQDPTDISKKFVVVDVDFFKTLTNPVTLEMIKKQKKLSHLALIKQSRLSVMPIDKNSWNLICLLSKNA